MTEAARLSLQVLLSMGLAAQPVAAAAQSDVLVVAHRARGGSAPENSLAAVRDSIARGIAAIEVDVRVTSDGVPVVMHDPTVERTTNGRGRVAELTLAQIRVLRLDDTTEAVPTLQEMLDAVRGRTTRLVLHVKDETPLAPVINLVRAAHAESSVTLAIGTLSAAREVRGRLPAVALIDTISEVDSYRALGVGAIRLWSDWLDPRIGGYPEAVKALEQRGFQVWCAVGRRLPRGKEAWRTVHAQLRTAGCDAIMTDRPALAH